MTLRELHVTMPSGPELLAYDSVYWGIDNLRQPFMDTPYAESLSSMEPRFKRYHWDDLEKFKAFLGDDVDPLKHGPYQAVTVGIPMVDAQEQGPADCPQLPEGFADLFITHHAQHDDHEGEHSVRKNMTHDVPYAEQTTENRIAEYELWKQIQAETFGNAEAREHASRISTFASPDAPDSFLKQFWDVSESVGYLLTVLRAWNISSCSTDVTGEERRRAKRLAIEVFGRQMPRIEESRGVIVHADDVLLGFSKQLREIKMARREQLR